jgi:N-acetylglucosamine-6-sulfatase
MTDHLNAQAIAFIKQPHTKPFCLYLAHKAVHNPYLPSPKYQDLYADYDFKVPPTSPDDLAGKPVMQRHLPPLNVLDLEGISAEPGEPRRGRGHTPADIVRDQLRCLASVDEGVGQIFAALQQTGELDNTVIVYTSDNGYLMGEHGKVDDKRWPYEEALRVPMLVRYPKKVAAGTIIDSMVLNVDMAPTLLDLAGVKSMVPMQGHSFVPLLGDPKAPWRDKFLAEYYLEKVVPSVPAWEAVRTNRWKYIHYYQESDSMDELYDLQSDPKDIKNLANEASAQSTLTEMRKDLSDLLKETK